MSQANNSSWPWLSRGFATTRWSLLKRAANAPEIHSLPCEDLCRIYWHPLYVFLRSRGHGEAESQDYVQSFLLRVLRHGILSKADQSRGRFRSYITTLLVRHVASERVRDAAAKRGGGVPGIPIDWTSAEAAFLNQAPLAATPEEVFRRTFAASLIEEAMSSLRERYSAPDQLQLFEALLPSLEGPLVGETYAAIASQLQMKTATVRVAVVRLRDKFREALRQAASAALHIPIGAQLDDELREIFQ